MFDKKSVLDHAIFTITIISAVFLVMYLYSSFNQNSNDLFQVNLAYKDNDKDGIINATDMCINKGNSINDTNNDGCPDPKGLTKETINILSQINPICKTQSCYNDLSNLQKAVNALTKIRWTDSYTAKNRNFNPLIKSVSNTIYKVCSDKEPHCEKITDMLRKVKKNLVELKINTKQ